MRSVVLPLTVASLALLPGCGEDTGAGAGTGSPSAAGSPTGDTELTIVVRSGPGLGKRTYSLSCDPASGDHPDPEAACRLLDELEKPLAPVPPNALCTEIYGGPQEATVTGTFRGEPVRTEFSRTDGCQIARWDAHVDLLVEAGGAQGS